MKISIQRFLAGSALLLCGVTPSFSQTPVSGDVRSVASGNWSNKGATSIWEEYRGAYSGWKVRAAADVGGDTINMRKPGYNASGWLKATVPGTIFGDHIDAGIEPDPRVGDNISKVDKAKYNRNFWYRTEFSVPARYTGKRIWLNFNGINKVGEIYINNTKLGGLKGFMKRGRYDVTKLVNKSGTNVIAVLIYPMKDQFNNWEMPSYMGANGWDWTPPIPGRGIGITDKVYLSASEDVTIVDPWVRTRELLNGNKSAKLSFTTDLKNHGDVARTAVITGTVMPGNFKVTATVPIGAKKQVTINYNDVIMNNVKLWWPNGYGDPNLYNLKLVCRVDGKLSDSTSFNFGIRKYNYKNDKNGVFNLYINGQKIYVKGGNWGMSDFMLKVRGEQYDTRVRFHKDMNMNMIRTWIGCVTDEEFYDACDKYGIMVWDDYWLNNRFTFLNDEKTFLANVPEKLKRLRNRAAIAVWCGANENVPFQDINLQDSTLKYDGGDRLYQSSSSGKNILSTNIKVQFGMPQQGGLSGSGPWNAASPVDYYNGNWIKRNGDPYVGQWGFRSEIGSAAFPNIESFKKFMPADKLWPRNDVWNTSHYFSDAWEYGGAASPGDYMNRVNNGYGTAAGIDEFCKKAQLMNVETHRAMFEGFQDHMWNDASGILMWMSQSAFPTMIWQTYDYYLDCTGAYYGVKKANEPIHIQYSYADNNVKIANTTGKTVNNLVATATVYNSDGTVASSFSNSKTVNSIKDTVVTAFNLYGSSNLALNKPGTASGQEANNNIPKAFDGSATTRWASNSAANDTWIYVDLGSQQTVGAVNLLWEAHAKSYKIQVSNNATTWTDVYSTTNGDGGTDNITFTPVSARYVKMQTVEKGTFFGVSLFEFAIYAQSQSSLSGVHFIKLELKDQAGNLVSENVYWKSNDNRYGSVLNNLPNINLTTTTSTETLPNGKKLMKLKLTNPANSAGIAFGVHVQLRSSSNNERVLPVLISDNYFTVFKGEDKNITIEYDPALVKGTPVLDIKQYTNQPAAPLPNKIQSPDKKVEFDVEVKNNRAYYKVDRDGKAVIESSPMVVSINGKLTNEVKEIKLLSTNIINETYPVRGVHSTAINHCTDAVYSVTGNGNSNFTLHVKVFNDGAAFRYEIPVTGSNSLPVDSTGFTIPAGSAIWSQGNLSDYEGTYTRRNIEDVANGLNAGPPVTIELPNNAGYAAIAEGGLTNFGGFALKFAGNRMFRANIRGANNFTGPINTPWRIIQVGADLNTLVNSDIIANVSPRPDPTLFPNGANESWLKPGKSVWSWIATPGGVPVFETNYKNMLNYSMKAGEMGIEYNLVDQGWEYFWATKTQTKWDVLKELVDKSAEVGVKIWVWKSFTPIAYWGDQGLKDPKWRREFFDSCKRAGVVGLKLDFFTGENQEVAKWQEDALRDAAELKLMLNFHGTPKPAGTEHTWPNEMTREGVRGLEFGTTNTVWSTHTTIIPFTRYLAGHADYTPFSLRDDIAKGTTITNRLASIAMMTSPLMVLGAFPDALATHPAKDVIKQIPVVWDETVVLPASKIGEVAILARRNGKTWYVTALNNVTAKSVNIKLSFLGAGSWRATEIKEGADIKQFTYSTGTYSNASSINLVLPANGGYLARFEQ